MARFYVYNNWIFNKDYQILDCLVIVNNANSLKILCSIHTMRFIVFNYCNSLNCKENNQSHKLITSNFDRNNVINRYIGIHIEKNASGWKNCKMLHIYSFFTLRNYIDIYI